MTKTTTVFSLLALALFISSCYKQDDYRNEDYDLTITHYDTDFDFTPYKTYYIIDSVGIISDYIEEGDSDWKKFYSKGGASNSIRNSVRQHFDALGYKQIKDSIQDADFAVNMVITLNQQTGYNYYPGYWGGYGGYWGGYYGGMGYGYSSWGMGYGGSYPWYGGGYGYSYTYKTGTLMLEMADGDALRDFINYVITEPDPSPSDPNAPKLKFVWSAFVDGYQDGNNNIDRLLNGIDEAFDNSPYLEKL